MISKKSSSGFTLVELMIVVAIIGILASIAIPNITTLMTRSKRTELTNGLGGIFVVEIAYFVGNTVYKAGSVDCLSNPISAWDHNFNVDNFFSLSQPAKFYGFCIDVTPTTFLGQGAGNIDPDPTIDQGYVVETNKQTVILTDDVIN